MRLHVSVSVFQANIRRCSLFKSGHVEDDTVRFFTLRLAERMANNKNNYKFLFLFYFMKKVIASDGQGKSNDFSHFITYFQYFNIFNLQNKAHDWVFLPAIGLV